MGFDLLVVSDCVLDVYYWVGGVLPIGVGDVRFADSMVVSPGGSCNVAVLVRRFGFSVAVVDRVGGDVFGDLLISGLDGVGVYTGFVRRVPGGVTTVSVNIVDSRGGHAFVGYPGVGVGLGVGDLDLGVFDGVRVVYVGGFNASVSRDAGVGLLGVVRVARGFAPVFVDVGPALGDRGVLFDLIRESSVVFLNEVEAVRLFGSPLGLALRSMRGFGVDFVVKLGGRGAVLVSGDGVVWCNAYRPGGVLTSVGAGDAFNAGFIAGVLGGLDPVRACDLGNRVASLRLGFRTPLDVPVLSGLLKEYVNR
jgi:ribokinase